MEEELRKSGWHIKPRALLDLVGDDDPSPSLSTARDALVAQLLDSDLKDVGSPSLPDALSLQRISRLQGPLVLQVVSAKNICQGSSKSLLRTGHAHLDGRLLRIHLTDGCTVISVIEYHSMPAFSVDTAPGTKVKLENTIPMQSGLLLGDARSFNILGGHVPALYESWEMERKYSGLTRLTTTKGLRAEDDSGPPPFHGLHESGQRNHNSKEKPPAALQGAHSTNPIQRASVRPDKSSELRTLIDSNFSQNHVNNERGNMAPEPAPTSNYPASSGSSCQPEIRTDLEDMGTVVKKVEDIRKDAIKAALALGVETAPSHNRVAAQKLLEKRADFNSRNETNRGRSLGGRGRGRRGARQVEEATLTLDEWEAKRGASIPSTSRRAFAHHDEASSYDDEALAQELHYQLNVQSRGHAATTADAAKEAEQIRLSMFSFAGGNDDGGQGRHGGRGRGRGRGRRRGR
ncbi:hypothetical protein GOP47_0006076 [Adiantum capillus-veneris]|uniref:RecQ mediated genome instability protein 1 OB-fold domain-containing protein n=1 Tax=Adiantum capillus-veneris TaxID=13818 RepID=A0A9D4V263_ADICA|nr:hypothetical protein GOP47_0006076 [Adiantum capillus-veneris]